MEVSGKKTKSADRNDFPTIDALCVLCKGDNVSTHANGFCKECNEIMCGDCFRKHLRLKPCQNHTFLDTIAPSEKHIRRNLSEMNCKQHGGETVKYYCRKHEAVGCGDCVVSKHSGCKTEFIKNLSDNFQQNEDYRTCMRQLEKLVSERKMFVKKIEESKKENKAMLEKALGDINEFRLDINTYLDKVERDIKCQVKTVMEENQTLLTKLENDCTVLSTKLEEITNMLNRELYTDNDLFIHTVEGKPKIIESKKAISGMKLRSIKKYEFVRDQQLHGAVTSAQKFGTLAFLSSAVFPQTTNRSNERSRIQQNAGNDAEGTHIRTKVVARGNTNEKSDVRSVVAVGARVQNNWRALEMFRILAGTVTDVHDDGCVTVKWDHDGHSGRCRIGVGPGEVSLIKS